jgi:hypothetical protein
MLSRALNNTAEQNHNIEKSNQSFANVPNFKYLGTALTNQNDKNEEINSTEYENLRNIPSRRFSFRLFSAPKN